MTLPSELADAVGSTVVRLPVRLWDGQARDGRAVSRLEFQSMYQSAVEVVAPVILRVDTD